MTLKAVAKLKTYIQQRKKVDSSWSQNKFARQLGCSRSHFSNLINCSNEKQKKPSLDLAVLIEQITSNEPVDGVGAIKVKDWVESENI